MHGALSPAPRAPGAPGRARPAPELPPHLTLLYRGPLASCDYDCPYCPFAKRRDDPGTLRADRAALERFADWVADRPAENPGTRVSVLFTPWGEGLVRSWYRTAIVRLSRLPHVERVAIQTNLSGRLGWLADCDLSSTALWTTYHPGQVSHERFLAKARELTAAGVRFSVGVVGEPDHLEAARRMRAELPGDVYLWVNAAEGRTYTDGEAAEWQALDPHFHYSRHPHPSLGRPCRTGDSVLSVDADGGVRRCHFVDTPMGNLYDGSFARDPGPSPCPLTSCDCHIGYVHLESLDLYDVFRGGVVERVPAVLPAASPGAAPTPPCTPVPGGTTSNRRRGQT
ncbi:STM4011 family radical SAM protein [Nocardiopsis tropica]|uniref:STM4011 family radical SAM protein n=1 Tax=Nocardiopsis tropica TaxID=109330 RepID=A0ABU7KK08_9ACTN|nr:STM4011 family radical SAM protein [Nocardiopsis umidischolae]MEE2049462.1 STM4011 family radical SAM protein [Nocardiopsis umidischolae]